MKYMFSYFFLYRKEGIIKRLIMIKEKLIRFKEKYFSQYEYNHKTFKELNIFLKLRYLIHRIKCKYQSFKTYVMLVESVMIRIPKSWILKNWLEYGGK